MHGQHLKQFREKAGFTQQYLADNLFKSRSAISKIENDEQEIDILTFVKWAQITNSEVQAAFILFGADVFAQATQVLSLVPTFIRFISIA